MLLAVLRRLRDTLSCRDIAEMRLERGFPSPPRRSGSGSAAARRASLSGSARSVGAAPAAPGTWTRPTCRSPGAGALSTAPSTARATSWTSRRSAHRDKHAARRFLRRLVDVAERKPPRVTTDAHPPYRRAIRGILGRTVPTPMQAILEQPHRAGPLGRQAALSPDARLRELRVCCAVLFRVRCGCARTSASVNDGVSRSRWPSSDGSSQRAGGH